MCLLLCDVAPGRGQLKRCLRLIQLSQRTPEAQPGITGVNTERLCNVERNAVERALELAAQVAILALDGRDQWPSLADDGDDAGVLCSCPPLAQLL